MVVLGTLAAACSQEKSTARIRGSDSEPSAQADTAAVSASASLPNGCDDLHARILAAAPTREAFAAAFGAPDSIAAATEPNRHVPNAVDSLFTVYYPGFVMDIRAPQGGRDMATSVLVEDNRYLAYPAIGLGARAEQLEEALGPPTASREDSLTWDCGLEVAQPVTFVLGNGQVARIEISYYVD